MANQTSSDQSHHGPWLERQATLQSQKRATSCLRPLNATILEEAKSLELSVYMDIDFHLNRWDVDEFKALYREHNYTPYQVAQFILWRVGIYNDALHAITQLAPQIFHEAKALASDLSNFDSLDSLWEIKPLWGIPLVIKDNIATGPDMPNTAGAYALMHATTTRPATIVKRLKDAGALIIGKANLSEWANFMTLDSSNGYSAVGGQAVNPFGAFDVGGSSAGSCVAVAAKLVPLAVGTETAGSLVYPASQNHLVTIKPTVGLVSRDLIVPIASTQDTAGPIANTVKDAALLLSILAGHCPRDPKTNVIPQISRNYIMDSQRGPSSKRIGIVMNEPVIQDYREGDSELLESAIVALKAQGFQVQEILVDDVGFHNRMFEVLLYEFYRDVNLYLSSPDVDTVLNLEDIVRYNGKDANNRAAFGQSLLERSIQNRPSVLEYQEAVGRGVLRASKAIYSALQSVDVLMTISNYATALYATAGYPAVNVPMGFRQSGEPVGLTFFAGAFQESLLIEVAGAFEKRDQIDQDQIDQDQIDQDQDQIDQDKIDEDK